MGSNDSKPSFAAAVTTKIRKAVLYDDGSEKFSAEFPKYAAKEDPPTLCLEGNLTYLNEQEARDLIALLTEAADFLAALQDISSGATPPTDGGA